MIFLAVCRIARECNAGCAVVAEIAEHHRLHVDRRAPFGRDAVALAIDDGAFVLPRTEHRADGAPELLVDVLRKFFLLAGLDEALVALDEFLQIIGAEFGVLRLVQVVFETVHQRIERIVRFLRRRGYTHHHAAVHLDEATVAVVREAWIRSALGEPLYGLVIQAEVQNRIHHAGHRFACAGAHRQQ